MSYGRSGDVICYQRREDGIYLINASNHGAFGRIYLNELYKKYIPGCADSSLPGEVLAIEGFASQTDFHHGNPINLTSGNSLYDRIIRGWNEKIERLKAGAAELLQQGDTITPRALPDSARQIHQTDGKTSIRLGDKQAELNCSTETKLSSLNLNGRNIPLLIDPKNASIALNFSPELGAFIVGKDCLERLQRSPENLRPLISEELCRFNYCSLSLHDQREFNEIFIKHPLLFQTLKECDMNLMPTGTSHSVMAQDKSHHLELPLGLPLPHDFINLGIAGVSSESSEDIGLKDRRVLSIGRSSRALAHTLCLLSGKMAYFSAAPKLKELNYDALPFESKPLKLLHVLAHNSQEREKVRVLFPDEAAIRSFCQQLREKTGVILAMPTEAARSQIVERQLTHSSQIEGIFREKDLTIGDKYLHSEHGRVTYKGSEGTDLVFSIGTTTLRAKPIESAQCVPLTEKLNSPAEKEFFIRQLTDLGIPPIRAALFFGLLGIKSVHQVKSDVYVPLRNAIDSIIQKYHLGTDTNSFITTGLTNLPLASQATPLEKIAPTLQRTIHGLQAIYQEIGYDPIRSAILRAVGSDFDNLTKFLTYQGRTIPHYLREYLAREIFFRGMNTLNSPDALSFYGISKTKHPHDLQFGVYTREKGAPRRDVLATNDALTIKENPSDRETIASIAEARLEEIRSHLLAHLDNSPDAFRQVIFVGVPGSAPKGPWGAIEFAREIAAQLTSTHLEALLRDRRASTQKSEDALMKRLENISGAYSIRTPLNKLIPNQTICFVDDVSTTGATAEDIRSLFYKAGAKKVLGIFCAGGD